MSTYLFIYLFIYVILNNELIANLLFGGVLPYKYVDVEQRFEFVLGFFMVFIDICHVVRHGVCVCDQY